MAASEVSAFDGLAMADIDAAMVLSTEAGWNQTADDWRHFIAHGRSICVRKPEGGLAASASALPYDGPFGFVSMVLVTADWRRRGIATRLVDRCVDELEATRRTPVLDATEEGAKVYAKQGFLGQFAFDRWQGTLAGPGVSDSAAPVDVSRIVARDAEVAGAGRQALLTDFLVRPETVALETFDGFALARAGRRATQVGPVVAADESGALALVQRLFARLRGLVFIDVPSRWSRIAAWLKATGFSIQRGFTRMALGRAEPFGQPSRLFSVAGPEFG